MVPSRAIPRALVGQQGTLRTSILELLLADKLINRNPERLRRTLLLIFVTAVDQLDGSHCGIPGVAISTRDEWIPACRFGTFGSVRAGRRSNPGILALGGPGLLAVDDEAVAVADGGRATRPDRSRFRLRKPWHHQMSRLAVAGRKRSLISWEPKCAITGPPCWR